MSDSTCLSIAVMTQSLKVEHLKNLFNCLLSQKLSSKKQIELLIFVDDANAFTYPQALSNRYILKTFQYPLPFNIGAVRNEAARQANGKFITFLDDDVLISPSYLESLLQKCSSSFCILAGLSFQVFKKPAELEHPYNQLAWETLVKKYGKRDDYTRRIGRYESEQLQSPKLGACNWLGCIGRNLAIKREIALKHPFFESLRLGFQDLEFAYRVEKDQHSVILTNDIHLSCLHIFHVHRAGKFQDYKLVFKELVEAQRLPNASKSYFFPRQ